jgi:multimeric flavodoxin WrbA
MKVVASNGSPRADGNTAVVLSAVSDVLRGEGVVTEIIQAGGQPLRGCIGCGFCRGSENNLCVFKDDIVNDSSLKMRAADGIILAAPTYFGGIPGDTKAFLDRVFFGGRSYFKYKVGAAYSVVRRAGGVDVTTQLKNYLTLSEMVLPPSQYWPIVYGMDRGEAKGDAEGMQTVRKNARAMAWLMKIIAAGRDKIPAPEDTEPKAVTNFIR